MYTNGFAKVNGTSLYYEMTGEVGPVVTDMGNTSSHDGKSAFSFDGEWIKSPNDVTKMALFLAFQPDIGSTLKVLA